MDTIQLILDALFGTAVLALTAELVARQHRGNDSWCQHCGAPYRWQHRGTCPRCGKPHPTG